METKNEIVTFKGHKEYISSIDFNGNGTILASSSGDSMIKL